MAVDGVTQRPRQVSIGFWLFVLGSVSLVLLGLVALTASHDSIRATLDDRGLSADRIDGFLQLILVEGVVSLLGGLVVGLLAGGLRRGDPRFRRAVVALAALLTLVQLGSYVLGLGGGVLVPVIFIAASIMVFVPASQEWFVPPEAPVA